LYTGGGIGDTINGGAQLTADHCYLEGEAKTGNLATGAVVTACEVIHP
jgi:hypothetical protein